MYKIFSSDTIEGLENIVAEKRLQGWNYVGGLAVVPANAFSIGALKNVRQDVVMNLENYEYGLLYLQAMTDEI